MIDNHKTLFLIFIYAIISPVNGQELGDARGIPLAPDFVAEKVADMTATPRGAIWATFRPDSRISPTDIFTQHGQSFLLSSEDDMILVRSGADDLGYSHYSYQQTYKGIKIEGAEMLVHARGGDAARVNGNIVVNLNLSVLPAILNEVALEAALNAIDAEMYMWENPEMEKRLQELQNDSKATYYPAVELVIARSSGSDALIAEKYRLAYRIPVYSLVPFSGFAVYVDALSGEVFRTVPLMPTSSQEATGSTLYNGTQGFITEYRADSSDYILRDYSRGDGIHTMNIIGWAEHTDTDTIWDAAAQRPAVSAHWAAEMTYDYFYTSHSRDSYDGNGKVLHLYTEVSMDNARWTGNFILLGTGGLGKASDDLVSLDIVGHEFSHAVDDYSANLGYEYESGALDESFADIFGTMVEFYAEGAGSGNYQIAEDMWISDGFVRDMSDPHFKDHPDTYGTGDSFWYTDSAHQDTMVHTNSGVQNYWFYLLAEGGFGTNENGIYNVVDGIGRDAAAAIAYRNLTQYLTSTSDYADAREGAIWAAGDLYGSSDEIAAVRNAWEAVGVGPSTPLDITLQNETVTADTLVYVAGNTITAGPAYTVESGLVLLLAKNSITLKPGFHAKSGSRFGAYVGPAFIPPPLSAPQGLVIVNADSVNYPPELSWYSVAYAASYKVFRRYAAGSWGVIGTPSATSYTDEDAVLDPTRPDLLEYYVTAVSAWDESDPSDTVSALGKLFKQIPGKEKPGIPAVYSLSPSYPNPFNPVTTLRFALPEEAEVTLVVYNLLGREVVRMLDGRLGAAHHQVVWHGQDSAGREVPSGLYIARLVARPSGEGRAFTKSVKMVLLR